MSKNKNKNNNSNINNFDNTKDLKTTIVEAILEADKRKKEVEELIAEQENHEWEKSIGLKNYSDKKALKRLFLTVLNRIIVALKIIFTPKKYPIKGRAIIAFFKTVMSSVWCFLIFINVLKAGYLVYNLCINISSPIIWIITIVTLLFLIAIISVFMTINRELDKITDKNELLLIFTAVMTIVSTSISAVTLIATIFK